MTESKVREISTDVKGSSQSIFTTLDTRKNDVVLSTDKASGIRYELNITLPEWMPTGEMLLDEKALLTHLKAMGPDMVLTTLQKGIAGRLIDVWALTRPRVVKGEKEDILAPAYPEIAQARVNAFLPEPLEKAKGKKVDMAVIRLMVEPMLKTGLTRDQIITFLAPAHGINAITQALDELS